AVGGLGPSVPAVDAYLAELGRLQERYGADLQGITAAEARNLERLARRVAEEAGLGEEVLEPIRAEERPPREGRFSRFRRRIAEAISPELRREATEDPLTGLANRGADERATDRKSVVQGEGVDVGGRRIAHEENNRYASWQRTPSEN